MDGTYLDLWFQTIGVDPVVYLAATGAVIVVSVALTCWAHVRVNARKRRRRLRRITRPKNLATGRKQMW